MTVLYLNYIVKLLHQFYHSSMRGYMQYIYKKANVLVDEIHRMINTQID